MFVDSPVTEDVLFENGKVGPVCHTNGKFIMTSSLISNKLLRNVHNLTIAEVLMRTTVLEILL